jgi:WbqC-like protein family.
MPDRAVIIQSNYVPWKGYFDLLAHADTVVFLDSVQSTKNDWRNRNQIKAQSGKTWLTLPIRHSNALRIREVEIAQQGWHGKHYRTLSQSYARAPFASAMLPRIEEMYAQAATLPRLSEVNRVFIRGICAMLGIAPRFLEVESVLSDREHDALEPTARLVEICKRIGATSYLSGPAARAYLDEAAFAAESIHTEWFDYDQYREYPQLHGPFDHAVSVLDLLLMVGPDARDYAIRPNPKFLLRSTA